MALVVPLGPGDGALLREVRLRSLREAPDAFTSSHGREAAFDEATWRHRLVTCRWFAALAPEEGLPARNRWRRPGNGDDRGDRPVVGIAGGMPGWSDAGDARQLVAMWVDPGHRRSGVAGDLLAAVADWAAADGARRLVLEVLADNEPARAFYRRAGLVPTGTGHHALADGGSVTVEVLELAL